MKVGQSDMGDMAVHTWQLVFMRNAESICKSTPFSVWILLFHFWIGYELAVETGANSGHKMSANIYTDVYLMTRQLSKATSLILDSAI